MTGRLSEGQTRRTEVEDLWVRRYSIKGGEWGIFANFR